MAEHFVHLSKFLVKSDKSLWAKVFKNGLNKICGRQPFKKFEVIWSA